MNQYNRVMVFDVETTGLLQKGEPPAPIDKQPYILQLSFVIYDMQINRVTKSVDLYIKVNENIDISSDITRITGISRETCESRGIPIENGLVEFYNEYLKCDCIVAHNMNFDREMIKIEMRRNAVKLEKMGCAWSNIFNPAFERQQNIKTFCTMNSGRNLCKIECENKYGKYYKNPKLSELYHHLFGEIPENLHNSLVDAYVCLSCFLKLRIIRENSGFPSNKGPSYI
jgi:DNA polymerase III epsilon subunit-like protein